MRYTIQKVTMENDTSYYKVRHAKWHTLRAIGRHLFNMSNTLFNTAHQTHRAALSTIQAQVTSEVATIKRNTVRSKETFDVHRTEIPSHIPEDQHVRFSSTPSTD